MKKSKRGFALMDKNKQREIARKGGRAAHRFGNAHEFTPQEAKIAGRKGGKSRAQNKKRGESLWQNMGNLLRNQ